MRWMAVMELDLNIVERYAAHLERKASARVTLYTISLALVGSILGAVPLYPFKYEIVPQHLGYLTLLVGAFAGGYLGYTMGMRGAEGLRLQAQMTLHQLQLERSLVLPAQAAAAAPAFVVSAPVVPAPAPAPVAPPPVATPVAPVPASPAPLPVTPP